MNLEHASQDTHPVSRTRPADLSPDHAEQATEPRVTLTVKLLFTAFVAVLVPYYWMEYGPTNFLYFCDVALFLALAAVWTERPLYASMAAVGITVPQLIWQVDFLSHCGGLELTGITDYMFDSDISLFARGLSFFHFWLPILLMYLVYRLGYDRRALPIWTLTAWCLILVSFFLLPPAGAELAFPNQPHNVNYVFGMDSSQPQTWIPQAAWVALLMAGLPLLVYLPTHAALRTAFDRSVIRAS